MPSLATKRVSVKAPTLCTESPMKKWRYEYWKQVTFSRLPHGCRFLQRRDIRKSLVSGSSMTISCRPDCVSAINAFLDELNRTWTRGLLSAQRVSLATTSPEIERSGLPRIVKCS